MDTGTDKKITKAIDCPHCGNRIDVGVRVGLYDPEKSSGKLRTLAEEDAEERAASRTEKFTPEQAAMLAAFETNGILRAFETALRARPVTDNLPNNIGAYFLDVLRKSTRKAIPRTSLDIIISELGLSPNMDHMELEFWSAQGIGMVIVRGRLLMFMPMALALGDAVKAAGKNGIKFRALRSEEELRQWVRTKMGYVPMDANNFMSELRAKSIGQYSNLSRVGAAVRI